MTRVYEFDTKASDVTGSGEYLGIVLHDWRGWIVEMREGWEIGPFASAPKATYWLRNWRGWEQAA